VLGQLCRRAVANSGCRIHVSWIDVILILQQDFTADFAALTAGLRPGYSGPPYAFVRYADGEAAILFGRRHRARSDGWRVSHRNCSSFRGPLFGALCCTLPGWYVGITAEEHHPKIHEELLQWVKLPLSQVTFAEIFIFANYREFQRSFAPEEYWIAAPAHCNTHVPPDAVETEWDYRPAVDDLIERADRPILVAAGPVANAIIWDYWQRCPDSRKQVILDAGSAIGLWVHRRYTRTFQRPGSVGYRDWRPKWKV
jgi:hypothetical protein